MGDSGRVAGLVFGEVAQEYDRVRPAYPDALIDDVLAYARLDEGRRAVEIGAGTGKATRGFAVRGVPIVAVEPDEAMAAVLVRHVPEVHIVQSTLEEYRPTEEFGLLYCADAWHWTRPETRWQLASRALADDGALALFWNHERFDDLAQRQSMVDVFAEIAPTVVIHDTPADPARLLAEWPGSELVERPEFDDLTVRLYHAPRTVSGADYLTHMSTRSQIRMLAEPVRVRLFAALADVFADVVPLSVVTGLYLARRVPDPTPPWTSLTP